MQSDEDLRAMSTADLCNAYDKKTFFHSLDRVHKELSRRDFTPRELRLMKENKVSVGMSEQALLCSWGRPKRINRSAYGPAQWVYGMGSYVYVKNGEVVNWQN